MTVQVSSAVKDGGGRPPDFGQPLPRRVRLRRDVIYMLWLIGSGLLPLSGFTILFGFVAGYHSAQLSAHGVHAQGTVRALMTTHERGGTRYRVDYGFTDPAPPNPIEAIQSGWAGVSEAQFRSLFVGGSVDIVFLPLRPDISALESGLVTASRNPWKRLEMVAVAIGLIETAGALVFAWFYWRERRLLRWGRHTAATVRDVWTDKWGRSRITHARFEFPDSAGITRQGLAHNVGEASQQAAGSSTRSFAAGDTATALYDPVDPTHADLYPLLLLTLAPQQLRSRGSAFVPPAS